MLNVKLYSTLIVFLSVAVSSCRARPNTPVNIVVSDPATSSAVNEKLKQRYLFTNNVLNDDAISQQQQNVVAVGSNSPLLKAVAVSSGVIVNNVEAPINGHSLLQGVPIHVVRQNDERDSNILKQLENQEALAQGKPRVSSPNIVAVDKTMVSNQALLMALESGNFSLIQALRQQPQQQSITTIVGNKRPQLVVVSPQQPPNAVVLSHIITNQQRPQVTNKPFVMPANTKAHGEVHSVQSGYRTSSFLAYSTTDDLLNLQRQRAREDELRLQHPHDSIILVKSTTALPPGEVDVTTASSAANNNNNNNNDDKLNDAQLLAFLIQNKGIKMTTTTIAPRLATPTTTTTTEEVPLDMLYIQRQRQQQVAQPLKEAVVVVLPIPSVTSTSTAASVRQTTQDRNDALPSFNAAALQREIANQALDRRHASSSATAIPSITTQTVTAATVAVDNASQAASSATAAETSTTSTTTTTAPVTKRQARIVLDAPAIESPEDAAERIRGQKSEVFYRVQPPPALKVRVVSLPTTAAPPASGK